MDMRWSPEELAFRDEVRDFLADKLTDEIRECGMLMTSVYADHERSMQWQQILYEKGWAGPAWPKQYGGADWTPVQRYIYTVERVRAGAPPVSPMGIQMCAPALLGFGTQAQKDFFLPRMLTGEHFWCQGYSEPGAGSDLASLQTSAADDGDFLICNGQKIWNTHANVANWGFFLVRTGKYDRPQKGITFLLIDMNTPGVSVRPIISYTGEHLQNEIFLDNVRVPKANVIGEIDQGWTVAKYLLEFERGGVAYAPELQVRLDQIVDAARETPTGGGGTLMDDPTFAVQIAAARVEINALEAFEFRVMNAEGRGDVPIAAASAMKIRGTELQQLTTELGMRVAGRYAMAYQPAAGLPGGPVTYPHQPDYIGPQFAALAPLRYLNERAGSIYAGSNEIQRNIIAKALGL
ncbi:acyl-CoA dehydrogenase family protein (plasmid) [Sphingobium sp. JS3065]|uniref:acyl-CoA dehydrogenase family protein n=1 Tax=Sphingobium sp. JS3065 TaxID=2970925 RepID=UPI002264252A|nr:acyl-CoA dehydrogenase family protein [Sphingobium sp. JS3065]UZW58272.1 acyl-CoA dehydrogenase family protein [Sphingobium sp. JS3065]